MAIDTSIWGQPEDWNYYDQSRYHDIRLPGLHVGQSYYRTLYRLVEAQALDEDEPIDKSICVSGMGSECPYSNITYITVDNGTLTTDTQSRSLTNWIFYNCDNFGIYTGRYRTTCLFKNNANAKYRNFSAILTEYYNGNSEITPFINFDFKKLVLYIRVVASSSETSAPAVFSLDDYIATDHVNYPYVRYVCARLYYEQSTNPTRRTYIHDGTIEGYHYATTAILDDYETTLTTPNLNRTYCNHISESRGNNIPVIGLSFYYTTTATLAPESDGRVYITYGVDDDWTVSKDENNNIILYYHVTDINVFKEKALRAAAAFGCYFTGDQTTAETGALTSNKMYIGVLDDRCVAHGDYLQGADTAQAAQNSWSSARESSYDPDADIDPTRYANDTQYYGQFSSRAFTKMYVLTDSDVSDLADELYTAVSLAPQGEEIERYNQSVFLTQNPIDCIISLKKFPMNLPYSAPIPMKLGSYTTQVEAAPLLYSTAVYSFIFAESSLNTLRPWFDKSFLDYEPYTRCEVSIPFCGTVEIPATYIYDYGSIQVDLIVDFITGACTGYVRARGITIDSVSGACSVTMPVNGLQQSTLDSQIHSAALAKDKMYATGGMAILGGIAAIGLGIATGGASVAIMGALAAVGGGLTAYTTNKQIDYQLEHMDTPLKQISAASGAIAQSYDMRCKMRITRPKLSDSYKRPGTETAASGQEIYARTIGHACLLQGIVSDFSGLTAGQIQLDGVNAPEPVKEMIKNIFAQGVYL